jgi:hypothetical protein
MVERNPVDERTPERTRANAERCHCCHAVSVDTGPLVGGDASIAAWHPCPPLDGAQAGQDHISSTGARAGPCSPHIPRPRKPGGTPAYTPEVAGSSPVAPAKAPANRHLRCPLGRNRPRLPGSHVHPEGSAVPNGPERPLPATTLGTSRAHPALSFAPLPSRHRNGPGKAREELRRGGAQLRPASVSPRESFTLSVASFNRRAITVYERVGFATVHVFSQWTHGAEWESSKRNDLPSASCRTRASSS